MRKRRNLIVALILVATMVMGIGYAALSTQLTIMGNAHSVIESVEQEKNLDILFQANSAKVVSATITTVGAPAAKEYTDAATLGTIASAYIGDNGKVGDNMLMASYAIGNETGHSLNLTKAGDTVVFQYTIENRSTDVDAKLDKIDLSQSGTLKDNGGTKIADGNAYYKRTVKIEVGTTTYTIGDNVAENGDKVVIPANGGTATVTVTVELIKTLGMGTNDSEVTLDGATILFDFNGD